eukprot:1226039-Amphidinium_carterae.1
MDFANPPLFTDGFEFKNRQSMPHIYSSNTRLLAEEFEDVEQMVEKLGPKGTAEAFIKAWCATDLT